MLPITKFFMIGTKWDKFSFIRYKIMGCHGNEKTKEWGWEQVCPGRNHHIPLGLLHPCPLNQSVQHLLCVSTRPSTENTEVSLPSWSLLLYQRHQMFGDYGNNYLIVVSIQAMQKWRECYKNIHWEEDLTQPGKTAHVSHQKC